MRDRLATPASTGAASTTPSSAAGPRSTTWSTSATTCGSASAACSWRASGSRAALGSGNDVILAGHVGVTDHLASATGARVGAKSAVFGDVPAGCDRRAATPRGPTGSSSARRRALYRLAPIVDELERLVGEAKRTMPRRTLAGEARVSGTGLHSGGRDHGRCAGRRRRGRASCSGGPTSPGAPEIPGPALRGAVDRAPHRAGRGRGRRADGGAPARGGRRARAGRPHGRAGRPRAADRRRLVRAVPRRAAARPASRSSRASRCVYRVDRAVPPYRGRLDLRRRARRRRSGSRRRSNGSHPLIGRQTGSYDITADEFARELAEARTFGFLREAEALRARGLALGRRRSSRRWCSPRTGWSAARLRWPDEFVRHKAGDILGDLALIGGRVQAHVDRHQTEPPGQHRAGPLARPHRTARRRRGRWTSAGSWTSSRTGTRFCWSTGSSRWRAPSGSSGSRT